MFLVVLKETQLTNSVILCSFLLEPGHSSRFLNPPPWIHHEQQKPSSISGSIYIYINFLGNLYGHFSTNKKRTPIVSKESAGKKHHPTSHSKVWVRSIHLYAKIIHYHIHVHPFLPGTNHLLPPACENWPVVENLPKIHMQNDLVKLANASSSRRVIPCHSPTRWRITPFFSTRWLSGSVLLSLGGYLRHFFRAWWYRYRYLNIWFLLAVQASNHHWKEWYFVVAVFLYIEGDVSVITSIQGIKWIKPFVYHQWPSCHTHTQKGLTWAPW